MIPIWSRWGLTRRRRLAHTLIGLALRDMVIELYEQKIEVLQRGGTR